MNVPEYFSDELEEHMRAAFTRAAHLADASPVEAARLFINFGLAMIAEFTIGDRLLEELDDAAAAVSAAQAEATAATH